MMYHNNIPVFRRYELDLVDAESYVIAYENVRNTSIKVPEPVVEAPEPVVKVPEPPSAAPSHKSLDLNMAS